MLHVTEGTKISVHSLPIAFFSFTITASIYTERFMGLPVESDNLEHYKVRIFPLCWSALNLNHTSMDKQNCEERKWPARSHGSNPVAAKLQEIHISIVTCSFVFINLKYAKLKDPYFCTWTSQAVLPMQTVSLGKNLRERLKCW